jgi:hypothetical protein
MGRILWTRIGAVLTALAAIPFGLGTFAEQLHHPIHMPDWLYILCFSGGIIGPVVIGFGASGNISSNQIKEVVEEHVANLQQGGPTVEEAKQEIQKG